MTEHSELVDTVFFCSAKLLYNFKKNVGIHFTKWDEIQAIFQDVKDLSPLTYDFILCGLDMIMESFVPEYIDMVMEYESIISIKKTDIPDEIRSITLMKHLFTKSFQIIELEFFIDLYMIQASYPIRDKMTLLLREVWTF